MTIVSLAENAYTEPLGPVNYMWLAKIFRVPSKTLPSPLFAVTELL